MTTLSVFVVTSLVAFLAGCAGTSGPTATTSGPPANVAGSWQGGTIGAGGATVTLVLQQTGTKVTGSIDVGGRPDLTGPLTGAVSGNTVQFKLDSGYGGTGQFNVAGNSMTGVVGGSGVRLQRN
jgi:hypothetical protein